MDEVAADRITPETKITAALVVIVLLLAFVALYIYPDRTDTDFAWTILPRTSAILIGAGYTAGAYFFVRVLLEKQWHRVQAGFLPITAFTVCMLVATVLHWGRFHQGQAAFYAWFIIYVLTPLVVPFLWWRNRRTAAAEPEPGDVQFSPLVSRLLRVGAALGVLAFVLVFLRPATLIALAPWKLTELTARIFAGWSILTLCTVYSVAADGRWSAARVLVESAMVGLLLALLALPRMWGDFDPAKPMTYALVGGIAVTFVLFLALHLWLDARRSPRAAAVHG